MFGLLESGFLLRFIMKALYTDSIARWGEVGNMNRYPVRFPRLGY
jgi:hypothetical protein